MEERQGRNVSSIATSDDCMSCGRCCLGLRFWVNHAGELGDRIQFLDSPAIQCSRVEGFTENSLVEINLPCSQLDTSGGAYRCGVYGSAERPSLCDEFPDNLFDPSDSGPPERTSRNLLIASVYRDYCRAIGRYFFAD